MIDEIDIDKLDDDLYAAWQYIQKKDYHRAEIKVAISWGAVHRFRLSLDYPHLGGTDDRGLIPWITRLIYRVLNQFINCNDYNCEWIYPYGFVPEAGCPKHD